MNPFFLPKLKTNSDVRPGRRGEWNQQSSKAFHDVAYSLDYQAPGEVKSISSIPTMWARPLSMEMALYNPAHPLHDQLIQEWQGMLAVIALAEVRGFPLKAQLLEIGVLAPDNQVINSLKQLLPAPVNTLYTLTGKNPWEDIYIFLWNGEPVGMTSPSTLVCPSEEGNWKALPWWLNGRLHPPHKFLSTTEKELLWLWLENLQIEITKYDGDRSAISRVSSLISDYRSGIEIVPTTTLRLSADPQFFGVAINRGTLSAINHPVKAPKIPSSVQLIPSQDKKITKPRLLIYDTYLPNAWNESPQNIWIYEGKNLDSINQQDLPDLKFKWEQQKEIILLTTQDLFFPELYFIMQEQALPGGIFPKGNEPIFFNGYPVTPLIPINPILLDYFTSEDLLKRLQIKPIEKEEGLAIRIVIDLPLSGVQSKSSPQNFRVFRDYILKEEYAILKTPILEVWPNFKAEEWQEYYVFYYNDESGDDTFYISLPEAEKFHILPIGEGIYQIAHLEIFPSLIICQDREKSPMGLILIKSPPIIQPIPIGSWTVGVDFGTSFTNIYVSRQDAIEPLPRENLNFTITATNIETKDSILHEYFIPEFAYQLPLSTVLTVKGSSTKSNNNACPIFDGRIYVPDYSGFKPQDDWIITDLKWSTEKISFRKLFLKHLALHISALAANKGIREIRWSLSFSSNSSRADINRYAELWLNFTNGLQDRTGIKYSCPSIDTLRYFYPESIAFAQYLADYEYYDLVYTTCIDIGGGTSDISIWESNTLIHQCSLRLAGQNIFSQLLELNPSVLESLFKFDLSQWEGLKGGAFSTKLDVWLREQSSFWLERNKFILEKENADFQGLIQLMAIGLSGLYYYVGILLRVLRLEGKYSRDEITSVFVGGRGSLFLNWLAEGGQFTKNSEVNMLLSRMLSQGSGFTDIGITTKMSSRPKDEVACGLLLTQTRLTGMENRNEDSLIAGEYCHINGLEIQWNSRLKFSGYLTDFFMPSLEHLKEFLYNFNIALLDLQIETIKPLKDLSSSLAIDQNSKLWSDTSRELASELLNMRGHRENTLLDPPFILGLKALLRVLARQWADR